MTRRHVEKDIGVMPFLEELRASLKNGTFTALPVRAGDDPEEERKASRAWDSDPA